MNHNNEDKNSTAEIDPTQSSEAPHEFPTWNDLMESGKISLENIDQIKPS